MVRRRRDKPPSHDQDITFWGAVLLSILNLTVILAESLPGATGDSSGPARPLVAPYQASSHITLAGRFNVSTVSHLDGSSQLSCHGGKVSGQDEPFQGRSDRRSGVGQIDFLSLLIDT